MARARMVTRTIVTTTATVMTVDTTTGSVSNVEVTVPQTFTDEAKLLKAVKKSVESDTVKAVSIVSSSNVETIYGMTEEKFISLANKLDADRKVIAE